MLVKHIAAYTHIFNRLRAIAIWSEIVTFSYLFAFNAPVCEFREKVWSSEN